MFREIPDYKSPYPDLFAAQVEVLSKTDGQRDFSVEDRDNHVLIPGEGFSLRILPLGESPRYHPQAVLEEALSKSTTTVLRVIDMETGQPLAAKSGSSHTAAPYEAGFLQELVHPNIVSFKGLAVQVEERNLRRIYMLMEWLSGGNLHEWIRLGNYTISDLASVFGQSSAALSHVNKMGYLYLDATPRNILFNGEGVVKLVDFENIRPLDDDGGCTCKHGSLLVTPLYASPEQIEVEDRREVRLYPQADVYSLAAVLFEMLTGKIGHSWERNTFVMNKKLPLPLRDEFRNEFRNELSTEQEGMLADILRRALAENYQERQPSIEMLNKEVQDVLN